MKRIILILVIAALGTGIGLQAVDQGFDQSLQAWQERVVDLQQRIDLIRQQRAVGENLPVSPISPGGPPPAPGTTPSTLPSPSIIYPQPAPIVPTIPQPSTPTPPPESPVPPSPEDKGLWDRIVDSVCGSNRERCGGEPPAQPQLEITTPSDLHARVGEYFVATFTVSGGSGNYAIEEKGEVSSGLAFTRTYCPPGRTCIQVESPDTITLYGTSTKDGSYPLELTARDGEGKTGKASFTLVVSPFAKLTITSIEPSQGPVGSRVILRGTGFTPKGNDINFAGVNRAVTGLSSPDGKTLVFTIPATPCSPGRVCVQKVLEPGAYPLSVTNASGTSNSLSFRVVP